MEKLTHYRPTKAIVDLDAIKTNVINLKKHIKDTVKIIAVVKANAYGHGDVHVANAAIEAGATMLAVATPDEAVHLRQAFPSIGILVLGASPIHFTSYAANHNISLTVFSSQWIEQIEPLQHPLNLHIKIDSGMGRIGVTNDEELLTLYSTISKRNDLLVEGVFTHFATADEEDESYFDNQISKFEKMLKLLPVKPEIVHAANTATALIKNEHYQFDAVRYGISLYGLSPSAYVQSILPFELQPALSLVTELVHIKKVNAGDAIGYGATFIADKDCYVGTLPIGYADGMIRKLSGQDVLIGGLRAPIIGRICMDQCMVLLPKAYTIGEPVTLIGRQGNDEITLDDWAQKLETINYEIPCILTNRVYREYKMK